MASDLCSFLNPKFLILIVLSCIVATEYCFQSASADYFDQDFDVSWGDGRGKMINNGKDLTLSLDKTSGSGIQSKNQYLYGRLDMNIKLVPGNSAGTVTTYYFSSQGSSHDEIDIEFLGNSTGEPYTLHTNVYTQGYGGREQQFHLWFDPTANYHTYTIIWNPQSIFFLVDNTPIREFKNLQSYGVPYPTSQPMSVYASLWDADDWATQGGRVKTDWTQAPFTASFTNYKADACVWNNGYSSCDSNPNSSWYLKQLNPGEQGQMKWVQNNYMIYNYCTDTKRFSQGMPIECNLNH